MTPEERKQLLEDILRTLNKCKVPATYGAVACILKTQPQGIGRLLGQRRPYASWVVNNKTGRPTGYEKHQCHPDLFPNLRRMKSCCELRKCLQLPLPVNEHGHGCDGGC